MLMELKGIHKSYPAVAGGETMPVLAGLSLDIPEGSLTAILGPSGSGKSTLLHILGSLDVPDSGQVLFRGDDLLGMDSRQRACHRNLKVGFVFQHHHLIPALSTLENVLVPAAAGFVKDTSGLLPRAKKLLEDLGLGKRLDHPVSLLSGGERQRTAVARAFLLSPPLILADEPTGALDQQTADRLAEVLADLCRAESTALVTVTHSLRLAGRMDRQFTLNLGQLEALP